MHFRYSAINNSGKLENGQIEPTQVDGQSRSAIAALSGLAEGNGGGENRGDLGFFFPSE
jgi:hypothetical protein